MSAASSSTDLWEVCNVEGCGKDAKFARSCGCRTGLNNRLVLCRDCNRNHCTVCSRCCQAVEVSPLSDAPTSLESFTSAHDLPLKIGDVCYVKPCAGPGSGGYGYLQYGPGEILDILYVGSKPEDKDWIYARQKMNQSEKGWLAKECVSVPTAQEIVACSDMKELRRLSKKLACIARHRANELGLTVREEGYIPLQQILDRMHCSEYAVCEVVQQSRHDDGSHRFEMCMMDCGPHLRSRQRRSILAPEVSAPTPTEGSEAPSDESKHHVREVSNNMVRQLKDLSKLWKSGCLSDQEFRDFKARLLE